jgi:hypothetical protein
MNGTVFSNGGLDIMVSLTLFDEAADAMNDGRGQKHYDISSKAPNVVLDDTVVGLTNSSSGAGGDNLSYAKGRLSENLLTSTVTLNQTTSSIVEDADSDEERDKFVSCSMKTFPCSSPQPDAEVTHSQHIDKTFHAGGSGVSSGHSKRNLSRLSLSLSSARVSSNKFSSQNMSSWDSKLSQVIMNGKLHGR